MTTPDKLEEKFWKAIESDRTLMLGLDGVDAGHTRPMTAQIEDGRGPMWFFTTKDNALVQQLDQGAAAVAAFVSKDHELFASIRGRLSIDNDPATIDRLWNRFVAAWFEGGKDDPKLALLRMDTEQAEIWLNEHSLIAGFKLLLGVDPKKDYKDKTAQVDL